MKCEKNTQSKNPKVVKTKTRRITLSSNCAVTGSKKSKFIKEKEAKGLLRLTGKIPLFSHLSK